MTLRDWAKRVAWLTAGFALGATWGGFSLGLMGYHL